MSMPPPPRPEAPVEIAPGRRRGGATADALADCRTLGCELALQRTGRADNRIIDMAALA